MALTPLVSIGAYNFPDPSEYEANTATIVDSARNVGGEMIGNVILNDVAKVTMSWKFITVENWANILKQFDPKYSGDFKRQVTFFNQTTGTWTTRTMYVSDRNAKIFKRDDDYNIIGYVGARLSLIDVGIKDERN